MRVAITRPRERADETERLIEEKGWEPLIVPTIDIVPRSIDPSIKLGDFDWMVVTSASAADILWSLFGRGLDKIDIAVVGPKTGAAFERRGIKPRLIAGKHIGEGLAMDLREYVVGKKVLVPRAAIARRELIHLLKEWADVTEIPLYDTLPPKDKSPLKQFRKLLEKGGVDALILTSSEATRNLCDFLGPEGPSLLNNIVVIAIGPVTARTAMECGIRIDVVPEKYTVPAALEAIGRFNKGRKLK